MAESYLRAVSSKTQVKAEDTFRFTFWVTGAFPTACDAVTVYMTFDETRIQVDALTIVLDEMDYDLASTYDNDVGTLDITVTLLEAPFPTSNFDVAYVDFTYLRPAAYGDNLSNIMDFDRITPRESGVWETGTNHADERVVLSDMTVICDRLRPITKIKVDSRFTVLCPISGCNTRIPRDAQAWIGHMILEHGGYSFSWTDWGRRGTEESGLRDSKTGYRFYRMAKHKCYGCNFGFQTAAELLTHLQDEHYIDI